jgi:ABC-type maltose transport system permease subunit
LTQSNRTLSVAMAQFIGGFSVAGSISRQSAAAVSATLPIVIVVLIFQKRLVKGLTSGAVKG